jgi:hypothetical protein
MRFNFKEVLKHFLFFKSMITPVIIQVVFWIALFLLVIIGLYSLLRGEVISGLIQLFLGPLFLRVAFETMIVLFRIQEDIAELKEIAQHKKR